MSRETPHPVVDEIGSLTPHTTAAILNSYLETYMTASVEPKIFHTAHYDDYEAIIKGLVDAIWDELHPDDVGVDDDIDFTEGYLISIWFDRSETGGYDIKAGKSDDLDDDEIEKIDPDFYITTYADESQRQIAEDLRGVMDEHFEDE